MNKQSRGGRQFNDQFQSSNDIFGTGSSSQSYQNSSQTSKAFGSKKQNYGSYEPEEDYSYQQQQMPRGGRGGQ
jgi:hypothetical protein